MYALVCIDPLTEHSKGTAFVKFKTVEQAEECVNKGEIGFSFSTFFLSRGLIEVTAA